MAGPWSAGVKYIGKNSSGGEYTKSATVTTSTGSGSGTYSISFKLTSPPGIFATTANSTATEGSTNNVVCNFYSNASATGTVYKAVKGTLKWKQDYKHTLNTTTYSINNKNYSYAAWTTTTTKTSGSIGNQNVYAIYTTAKSGGVYSLTHPSITTPAYPSSVSTGYKIAGWKYVSGNSKDAAYGVTYKSGVNIGGSISYTGTKKFGLIVTANTYTVKYDGNGATSGTMADTSATYGKTFPLRANAFKKTGYTFAGWATSATGTKAYNDQQSVSNLTSTDGGVVTLFALWTAGTFTVTANVNGGTWTNVWNSWTKVDDTKAKIDKTFGKTFSHGFPGCTYADGSKIFRSWNTKANGTGATITTSTVYNDVNLTNIYAIWGDMLAVTFDCNGGIHPKYNDASTFTVDFPVGVGKFNVKTMPNPIREGYIFTGWYTTKDSGGVQIYNYKNYKESDLAENIPTYYNSSTNTWVYVNIGFTLYARWKKADKFVYISGASDQEYFRDGWHAVEGFGYNDGWKELSKIYAYDGSSWKGGANNV